MNQRRHSSFDREPCRERQSGMRGFQETRISSDNQAESLHVLSEARNMFDCGKPPEFCRTHPVNHHTWSNTSSPHTRPREIPPTGQGTCSCRGAGDHGHPAKSDAYRVPYRPIETILIYRSRRPSAPGFHHANIQTGTQPPSGAPTPGDRGGRRESQVRGRRRLRRRSDGLSLRLKEDQGTQER